MDSKPWLGQTVAVVASGPSLTSEDCALIGAAGLPTIAVNSSWKAARFAGVIYAGDACWWDQYGHEIDIPAERWTCTRQAAAKYGIKYHRASGAYNSGMRAIQFAIERGASRIILIGFDCSLENGVHWHGPHSKTKNPTPERVRLWRRQFLAVAMLAKAGKCEVLNCSRHTALEAFERANLEDALEMESRALFIQGMHGMGDNLHQRSIVRELMRDNEVWLETPWPSIYHDMPELHLVQKGSKLRTQAKNLARELDLYPETQCPANVRQLHIHYPPAMVRKHRSVLAAMSAQAGVPVGDFRMPVPWEHGLDLPDGRPVLAFRPLVERSEWGGNRNRNPHVGSYLEMLSAIRDRFYVVSVADLEDRKEWMVHDDIGADLTLHKGELTFQQLAALWRDATMVMTAPGFGVVLAQAVGTPVVSVFGGYEGGYSFDSGARYTPTLAITPIRQCDCFSHTHRCNKTIDMPKALDQITKFTDECIENANRRVQAEQAA